MRIILAGFFAIAALSFYFFPALNIEKAKSSHISRQMNHVEPTNYSTVNSHAVQLKSYLHKYKFNEQICFLIDMKIPPGKNRFFVYDFNKDQWLIKDW